MAVRTRGQVLMAQAAKNVQSVKDNIQRGSVTEKAGGIYGSLCHRFPVLIRTCGLCQAVAFVESKTVSSDSNRKTAHEILALHISEVLKSAGFQIDDELQPSKSIAGYAMRDYALAERVVLDSWVYHKRFAESVLGVEPGEDR